MNKHITVITCLVLSLLVATCGPAPKQVTTQDRAVKGNPEASIELVVYSDFQCSFCKRMAQTLDLLHNQYPNQFKYYFKHFPLKRHPYATEAAKAAEAAKQQGKFWEMHDMLFAYSGELNGSTFELLAKKLHLNMEKFSSDFHSDTVASLIAADRAEGIKNGLIGTPYILIDGVPFSGSADQLKTYLKRKFE